MHKGDLIVEIDPADYRAQLAQAEANLAAAQATLANLANQKDVQRALIRQAGGDHPGNRCRFATIRIGGERQRELLQTRIAGTPQLVEQAEANEKRTAAQLELNKAQLDQQKALLASLDVQEQQLAAQVRAAEAQVTLARNNLGYTRIVSPVDGMVGQRQVRPGQFVNVGTQVIAVVPLPKIWVIANFKETQMTNVRLGNPARVTVDAFPDLVLTGRVDSWSPGTGSTFALLPPDNATGNFTKVVQRVPVKIVLDPNPSLGTLVRPGLSVEARIDTGAGPGPARTLDKESAPTQMRLHLAPVTSAGVALHAIRRFASAADGGLAAPYVGMLGVLLGSIMGTLGSRVTSFGLADLRGGLSAGFDEGAWITTSYGIGQMLVGVASPYLGAMFGVRRVLLLGILLFFITSLLAPLSPNLNAFLVMQFLGGVGSGTFIPLTISFILRSLPARLVIFAIALYAMNSELSQNIAASLEGWYSDHWSWRWINWQYCAMLPVMFACVWYGIPRESSEHGAAARSRLARRHLCRDRIQSALCGARPGQPARLERQRPGQRLAAGRRHHDLAFVARELVVSRRPFLNLRLLVRENLPYLLLLLAGYRFIILSTAYIIPTYLQTVQNFRELQVGAVLLWIALPQFIIVYPLSALLRQVDGRWVLAFGPH